MLILSSLVQLFSISVSSDQHRFIFSKSIPTTSKIIFIIDDIHFVMKLHLNIYFTLGVIEIFIILSMKPPRNNSNDRSNSDIYNH
jgi:hypothetical protein